MNMKLLYPINLRLLVIIVTGIVVSSCAKKISPLYKYNTYLDDFENFVINDSIEFIHKTYGNIDFPRSKEALSIFIDSNFPGLNGVLLAANSRDTVDIKYAILINPSGKKKLRKGNYHLRDTVIDNNHYVFVSNRKWTLQGWDLKNPIIDAFYVGKDYQKYIPGLFDFQSSCSQTITFLRCLKGYGDYPNLDDSVESMKLQMQLTYASFLGENYLYDQLLKKYNSKKDLSKEVSELRINGVSGWSEISDRIIELSKEKQIIMFSENHFKPQHRKTVTALLPELRKQGYSYLALEALSNGSDSLLNKGSEVLNTMGFYTREQNFVELLETAQNLGFTIVSYDEFIKERELAQAKNLLAKTLQHDPKAKIVVLAGFGHINEGPNKSGNQMMAGYLKSISGIDPITISQTVFSKHSVKGLSEILFTESEYIPTEYRKKTDFTLIHPDGLGTPKNQKVNFSYKNPNDFDIQLGIYRTEDLEHAFSYAKMPPIRSVLVPSNGMIEIYLKTGETYKYYVLDEKSLKRDEGDIQL